MGITLVGELPAGYLSDRIGHRNSLIAGSLLLSAASLGSRSPVAESVRDIHSVRRGGHGSG